MGLTYRLYDPEQDYQDFTSWCHDWKWAVIPREYLPVNGVVILDGTEKVAMGFLYLTDSLICWMENIVSNKNADKASRSNGVDLLISQITSLAKEKGYNVVMTSINHKGLMTRLDKNGFIKTDANMTNFLKAL